MWCSFGDKKGNVLIFLFYMLCYLYKKNWLYFCFVYNDNIIRLNFLFSEKKISREWEYSFFKVNC